MAERDRLGTDALLVVRTGQPSDVLPGLVADHVRALSPYATTEIMPLADRLSLSVARPRFAAAALGGFALVSLLLATAGLYGAVSFAVARRRFELGVRSALGAGRGALIPRACCAAIDHSSRVVVLDETEALHPSKVVVQRPEG